MKLKYLASLLLATLFFASCDDNTGTLGYTLTESSDNLTISSDSFVVKSNSILVDSVLSRNTIAYLGKVRDPETGAYITGNCMIQFHTMDNTSMPDIDSILSKSGGEIIADSCEIRLYYSDYYGDSLATMKLTAYEMDHPMLENVKYYSNFDPEANGYIRDGGYQVDQVYSLSDYATSDSLKGTSTYTPSIRIWLNDEYTDKNNKTYNNYGTYLMRKYYENPSNFTNSVKFLNNIAPGFYFKMKSGLGSMAYVRVSQLNAYYRFIYNDTVYNGVMSFSGTEEVLQTTYISNDDQTLQKLASDNTCTYLKTPAGIFTELTLPVTDIMNGHENDTINSAKLVLTRINNSSKSSYALDPPSTLLLIPSDELYTFFEDGKLPDYKTSFIASYSSSTNTYTFNNISGLINYMRQRGSSTSDWNKAVLVPVTLSTQTNSSTGLTSITACYHDMSLTSTKLVGGSANPYDDIQIGVIYSKFK